MPGHGYLSDTHDPRDVSYGSLLGTPPAPPLRSNTLFGCARLIDQEDGEGCVGWSLAGAITTRWNYLRARQGLGPLHQQPSPMWVWWLARKYNGTQAWNVGTRIRDAIKQVASVGLCEESRHVSNPPTELIGGGVERFASPPSVAAFQQAYDQRFPVGYTRVSDSLTARQQEIRHSLDAGIPIVFGTQVTRQFTRLGKHSPVLPPAPGEPTDGHAMQACWYDEHGVYGPGTWGPLWGNDGWFSLSWQYMLWSSTQDLWSVNCELPAVWP